MIFLPIVERELRVAARKPSTPWFRVVAALVALVIGAGFLLMSISIGAGVVRFGSGLFSTLTWLALAATLTAGLFFTADSLSEEKREGTLGFLFLTDLQGYDVVGGKLLATSLRGFFALLAVFPVLAVTLLMGGVTGAEFSKSSLALVNALFVSLAAGLLASSLCRDSQRSMAATLVLIVLFCAAGPIVDSVFAAARKTGFRPIGSLASPVYVFWTASAWGKTAFWQSLLTSHLVAWAAFGLACGLTPRTWQDRPAQSPGLSGNRSYAWKYGGPRARAARRSKLMSLHPVLWLALRERWQAMVAWLLVGSMVLVFGVMASTMPGMTWVVWRQLSWVIVVVLYLWTASHACRFFVDAKHSGLMEVILVTPLDGKDIVLGQWHALLRLFGIPVLVVLIVQFASGLLAQQTTMRMMAATAGPNGLPLLWYLLNAIAGALTASANLAALIWFGMWMGLTSKNASLATLRTMLFVQVLPWFVITFASTVLAALLAFRSSMKGTGNPNSFVLSFPLMIGGLSFLLSLGKDAAFICWARKKLFSDFREEAVRALNTRATKVLPGSASVAMPLVMPKHG